MEINTIQLKQSQPPKNYIRVQKAIDKHLTKITELQERIAEEEELLRGLFNRAKQLEGHLPVEPEISWAA